MRTFKQNSWNEQMDVVIGDDGIVSVDGEAVETIMEKSLGNIILRLNAEVLHWKQKAEELEKRCYRVKG